MNSKIYYKEKLFKKIIFNSIIILKSLPILKMKKLNTNNFIHNTFYLILNTKQNDSLQKQQTGR
jgi:hypothetical protein